MKYYKTNIPLSTLKQVAQQKRIDTQCALMMIFTKWCVCVCVCVSVYIPTHRPGGNIQTTYTERNLKFPASCTLQWEGRNGKVCGKRSKTVFILNIHVLIPSSDKFQVRYKVTQ